MKDTIIHITAKSNAQRIQLTGILPPSLALEQGAIAVFGSEGSNTEVVQLFDLGGATKSEIRFAIIGIYSDMKPPRIRELVVIECDPELRQSNAYVSPATVHQICERDGLRHSPTFEAWFRDIVPPDRMQHHVPLQDWCEKRGIRVKF